MIIDNCGQKHEKSVVSASGFFYKEKRKKEKRYGQYMEKFYI